MKFSRTKQTKIVKTGLKFTCFAPEYLTEFNKQQNKIVYSTCKVEPKFKPQVACRGCMYLEQETDGF